MTTLFLIIFRQSDTAVQNNEKLSVVKSPEANFVLKRKATLLYCLLKCGHIINILVKISLVKKSIAHAQFNFFHIFKTFMLTIVLDLYSFIACIQL